VKRAPLTVVRGREAGGTLGAGHAAEWSRPRTRTLVVTSGKGGVGKSNLAANLALAMAERGARVLLVDGDLAQANLDLLLGVHPRWDVSHFLAGERTFDETLVAAGVGVRLAPAASGAPDLADLDDLRRETWWRAIGAVEPAPDLVLVDTAAGASRQTTELCRAAHETVVLTTPEMPAFSDAYALVKLLHQQGLMRAPRLVVSMATSAEEGDETAHHLALVARRFLRVELDLLGQVPFDAAVPRAVRLQEPVLRAFPESAAARAYRAMAASLWKGPVAGPQPEAEVDPLDQPHRLEA
jgi:flagellar biosynthesis protein FlhG